MAKVKYDDLEAAFEFVNAGAPMEHRAYIALDTGKVYWMSDYVDPDEERPDDVGDTDRYLSVPHKKDLDLGRYLVTRFVQQTMPAQGGDVDAIFRRRGAYRRFKEFLEAKGQLEQWYEFEAAAQQTALQDWCVKNKIEIAGARPYAGAQGLSAKTTIKPAVKPTIRPVAGADAAAICDIYNPYVLNSVITFEQAPISEKDMVKRIRDTTAHYPWLVAEVEGKVVAFAYATRWRARAAYDHTLESTIYVDKAHTGRGIAKPLYVELLRELKARRAHAVVGCIALPNDASVAVHEKCGFVKVAQFPQVGRKFDRWVDVGFWQHTFT